MSLREILIDELKDLYSAENQLIKSLPKTAKACESEELQQVFLKHIEETKGQVERLKNIFELLGKKATGKHCSGMEGAIDEVKEALDEEEEGALFDAGLLGAALRVEHYEIAGYSSAIALARQLGETEIVGMLTQTLTEELNAGKLIQVAGKKILKEAYAMEPDEDKPEKKPKDAKEKLSEAESKKDEQDAQKGMKSTAVDSVDEADDKDDEQAKAKDEKEDAEKDMKKATASKSVAKKAARKSTKK